MPQDETKNLMDNEIDLSDKIDFYLNKIIAPFTNDKDDMDTHRTSKFSFYHEARFERRRLQNKTYYRLR